MNTKQIKIFIVDDDPMICELISMNLSEIENYSTEIIYTGEQLICKLYENPDIIILDYNIQEYTGLQLFKLIQEYNSKISVIFLSGQSDVNIVVEAYKRGIKNYIVKNENAIIELLNAINNQANSINLLHEIDYWKSQIFERAKYEKIIGESPSIMKILKMMQKVEKSNVLTLISGESGTGKELVAQAIHYNSERRKKPYVIVNLAAIPDDLVEAELFGFEKGAFTGADSKRIGKFEEAQGGSIFLDEIGELDVALQTKLLRVLQEGIVTRLGSNKEIKLDVRIIAATNKNLANQVKECKFRQDLYYRLQGFLIHLPPLRERGNDVIILCKYFMKQICEQNKISIKTFSPEAYKQIINHKWPGNIRELRSFVERSILVSDENEISVDDLIFSQEIAY